MKMTHKALLSLTTRRWSRTTSVERVALRVGELWGVVILSSLSVDRVR